MLKTRIPPQMSYRKVRGTKAIVTRGGSMIGAPVGPSAERKLHDIAWKLHKGLYKIKGACKDVKLEIFEGYSPVNEEANASSSKPIIKSQDRMYIVGRGASLHMMEITSLHPSGKNNHQENKKQIGNTTANGTLPSTTEATVCFGAKLVEDFPLVWWLSRLCHELGHSNSWQPGENPEFTEGKKTIECCIEYFVELVAVPKQTATPLFETIPSEPSPARRHLVPEKEVKETL